MATHNPTRLVAHLLFLCLAGASNVATRVLLTDAVKAGAVCLDGSPAAVYVKLGDPFKFVILQRGGG